MRQATQQVNIFIIQKPIGNYIPIKIIYKEFGENIPHFCFLEGNYTCSQYLCCVDSSIDFESICEKYEYRYYPAFKFKVDKNKYNSEYEIRQNYFNKEQPYILERYVQSPYYDSDEESK